MGHLSPDDKSQFQFQFKLIQDLGEDVVPLAALRIKQGGINSIVRLKQCKIAGLTGTHVLRDVEKIRCARYIMHQKSPRAWPPSLPGLPQDSTEHQNCAKHVLIAFQIFVF